MSLRTRNWLAAIFILTFIILTTTISLYASGYKLNLHWPLNNHSLLQKTGMFIIDTEPNGAIIYINDKPKKIIFKNIFRSNRDYLKTPGKIKNQLPGQYEIRLEKEGYWTWQDTVTINPGQSTILEDIILFKKSLPWQIINNASQELNFSGDKRFVILSDAKKIIDLKNEEEFNLQLNEPIQSLYWLDNRRVIADNYLISLDAPNEKQILEQILGANISNLRSNGSKLYYQYKKSLNCFDLGNKTNESLVSNLEIIDYRLRDNNLIILIPDGLIIYSLDQRKEIKRIPLSYSPDYGFLNEANTLINIINKDYHSLYLIDINNNDNPIRENLSNFQTGSWIDDNQLLYSTGQEIYLYKFREDDQRLIVRLSEKIKDISWHPKAYILYSTNDSIHLIDFGNNQTDTTLLRGEDIRSLTLNNKADTVYFTAKIGNQQGLYKLFIQ